MNNVKYPLEFEIKDGEKHLDPLSAVPFVGDFRDDQAVPYENNPFNAFFPNRLVLDVAEKSGFVVHLLRSDPLDLHRTTYIFLKNLKAYDRIDILFYRIGDANTTHVVFLEQYTVLDEVPYAAVIDINWIGGEPLFRWPPAGKDRRMVSLRIGPGAPTKQVTGYHQPWYSL